MRTSSVARFGLAGLALLSLGYLVVRDAAAAGALRAGRAAAATATAPRYAAALSLAAQDAIIGRNPRSAEALAGRALAVAPMDAAALRSLVMAYAEQRKAAPAATALRLAGSLGWRDTPTQLLVLADAMAAGDMTITAQRADALARRHQELEQVYGVMRALARRPDGAAALIPRLRLGPEWRGSFLAEVDPLQPEDYAGRERIYAGLVSGVTPPLGREVEPYVAMLVARREYARARANWLRYGPSGGDLGDALQDGSFAQVSQGSVGFGWTAGQVIGGSVAADQEFDPGRSVLRADSNGSAAGALLSQMLTLRPGTHRFAVDAAFSAPPAREGLRWVLRCGQNGPEVPMDVKPAGTLNRWTQLAAVFAVPSTDCAAQTLELRARSVDLSTPISAWFNRASVR